MPRGALPAALATIRREVHANLRQANYDIGKFQFNTVVSASMKILNALERAPQDADAATRTAVVAEGLSVLLRLLSPITPHVCHALWRDLGFGADIVTAAWPAHDEAALVQDEVDLVLQVNGKKRGDLRVARDADKATIEAAALAHEQVVRFGAGQTPKKVVVVPGRLVNVVF
jgi:leucyl-tRNA synthetase